MAVTAACSVISVPFLFATILIGWLLSTATAITSVSVINNEADGTKIEIKCTSCTYIKDNIYHRTNSSGEPIITFDCDDSFVTNQFCGNIFAESIPVITPDPIQLCKANQKQISCIADKFQPITVWGDERSDPSYITARVDASTLATLVAGHGRDFTPNTYALLNNRGQYTPKNTRAFGLGEPDVYAFYKHSPGMTLGGVATYPLPNSSFLYPSHFTYDFMPRYKNSNTKLFYYAGHTDFAVPLIQKHNSCPQYPEGGFGEAEMKCYTAGFLDYISSHRNVETVRLEDYITVDMSFYEFTLTEHSNYKTLYSSIYNCGNDCFKDMTLARGLVTLLNRSSSFARSGGAPITNFGLPLAPTVHLPFSITNPAALQTLIISFIRDGNPISYPLLLLEHDGLGSIRSRSRFTMVEESFDGKTWTAHKECASKRFIDAYNEKDWDKVFFLINDNTGDVYSHTTSSGWWGTTGKLYTPSKGNKYLRLVTLHGFGNYAKHRLATANNYPTYIPAYILSADSRQSVSLFVTPSLSTTTPDLGDVMGLDYCKKIPTCTYIPAPVSLYPSDSSITGMGSTTIRNFMEKVVIPVVFDKCRKIVPDPVKEFLVSPYKAAEQCIRYDVDPAKLTCYNTFDAPHSGPATIYTDVFQNTVEYRKNNFGMRVTTKIQNPGYPVPSVVIGTPFTLTNMTPVAWLYNSPVVNSLKVPNASLYVATGERCTLTPRGVIEPELALSSNCDCIDYPLTTDKCLCTNLISYKNVQQIPDGVTFTYPHFFTPLAFPLNYTVVNSRVSYDYNLYTTVDIDCPVFLCSNNQDCISRLQTSNYLTFCNNQKLILQTTLKSLKDTTVDIHKSVQEFLRETSIPSDVSLLSFPPIDGVSPVATSTTMASDNRNLANSMANYYSKTRSARSTLGDTVSVYRSLSAISGYKYRNPFTSQGESIGISLVANIGVTILSQKINTLASNQEGLIRYADYLAGKINELAEHVQTGFEASYNAIQALSDSHNELVSEVNSNFAKQTIYNQGIAGAINTISDQLSDTIDIVNFIDLIGSRATTLGIQGSAIMVKALDHIVRGREFKTRVDACRAATSSSSEICAGSTNAILLGTSIKQTGTVATIDSLLLQPDAIKHVYGTPEFCYNGVHYTVISADYVFILHDNVMKISTKIFWDPEPITTTNTRILPKCNNPRIVITDLTPNVPIVQIDTTTETALLIPIEKLNVTAEALANVTSFVNVTSSLAILNGTINALEDFKVEEFAAVVGDYIYFDSGGATSLGLAIGALILAILAVGLVIYFGCKKSSSRYVI